MYNLVHQSDGSFLFVAQPHYIVLNQRNNYILLNQNALAFTPCRIYT